jgi:hypothetical protein
MKFNININQERLSDYDITLQDACVLDWLYGMFGSDSERVSEKRIKGFTWISLPHLIEDMPLLGIKTNSGASKLIKRIKSLGFIETFTERSTSKLYAKPTEKLRSIYFGSKSSKTYPQVLADSTQVLQDTNQYTNTNTLNNTISEEEKKGKLPDSLGKTYIQRLMSIYTRLFKKKYDFAPKIDFGRFGKGMKTLIETHTEIQIASMLTVFFNWHGMTGTEDFAYKKLLEATFNPQWFFSTTNQYEAHIRNVSGFNFDDEVEMMNFIRNNLKE